MSKKVISFFSFGFVLIVVGIIGKMLNWGQATVILATGLVFESVAIIMLAFELGLID